MLNLTSLRQQVYDFLRREMNEGRLLPGANIDQGALAAELGISKTPLRDALIQLETEGFVEILPRRGVRVAGLSLTDVRNLYQIIGLLEGGIIIEYYDLITPARIAEMDRLNQRMREAIGAEDYDGYYNLNLEFHGIYVDLSDNEDMKRWLIIMKQRLYDFPRRSYIKEWELSNCDEHAVFIDKLREDDPDAAATIMRDVHWSYLVQKENIRRFYSKVARQIKADAAARAAE